MDASAVDLDLRLNRIGLSDEQRDIIKDKIFAGSINPSGWNYISDADLACRLLKLIQQGTSLIFLIL
jgi:hypothetical protein